MIFVCLNINGVIHKLGLTAGLCLLAMSPERLLMSLTTLLKQSSVHWNMRPVMGLENASTGEDFRLQVKTFVKQKDRASVSPWQ